MKPVTLPDHILPGNSRKTIGGESDTQPAEYVYEDRDGPKWSTLITLTDDDLERMQESGLLWFTFHGDPIPFTIGIAKLAPEGEAPKGWDEVQ